MKKPTLALFAIFLGCAALPLAPAEARDSVHIGIGGGYYGGYGAPYYPGYYYGGYPPYYYDAPPTVVYAAPPPVTYVQPPAQQVIVQQPQAAPPQQYQDASPPPPAPKKGSSQTYIDSQGRTCRKFETTVNGDPVGGVACLQPDGTWRTVNEE